MKLKPITNEQKYNYYLKWVDNAFDSKVQPSTPEGDKLQIVLLLIKDYEDKHFPTTKLVNL